jgi:hypothetical protein
MNTTIFYSIQNTKDIEMITEFCLASQDYMSQMYDTNLQQKKVSPRSPPSSKVLVQPPLIDNSDIQVSSQLTKAQRRHRRRRNKRKSDLDQRLAINQNSS